MSLYLPPFHYGRHPDLGLINEIASAITLLSCIERLVKFNSIISIFSDEVEVQIDRYIMTLDENGNPVFKIE